MALWLSYNQDEGGSGTSHWTAMSRYPLEAITERSMAYMMAWRTRASAVSMPSDRFGTSIS